MTKMKSWLVQRGKIKEVEDNKISGVNSLIRFDYMGSAEFEFGALPQSLRRITSNINDYCFIRVENIKNTDGAPMYIYCRNKLSKAITGCAAILSRERHGWKEYCDMPDYVEGKDSRNNFWWDIENDFMVCFGKKHAQKLEIAISRLRDRWYG